MVMWVLAHSIQCKKRTKSPAKNTAIVDCWFLYYSERRYGNDCSDCLLFSTSKCSSQLQQHIAPNPNYCGCGIKPKMYGQRNRLPILERPWNIACCNFKWQIDRNFNLVLKIPYLHNFTFPQGSFPSSISTPKLLWLTYCLHKYSTLMTSIAKTGEVVVHGFIQYQKLFQWK